MYSGATIIGTHNNRDTTTIGTPILAVIAVLEINPRVPDSWLIHTPEQGFEPVNSCNYRQMQVQEMSPNS